METNLPVVTVLLPTYNCEHYVRDSLQSILDQTFTDFELLVIDDASTDRTVEVIRELKDPRIQLIQKQKNSGYTDSLNQGIALARGRYIARMDADDISLPTRFEKQVNFLASHNDVAVCGTWYMEIPNNHIAKLPTEHEDIKVAMLENNQLCHPSVMFKKDFFLAHHLSYKREFESAEDYELWTRLIAFGK
ncbi:MAG TPA: glycosyltransferase, partial [Flavisolibacter sp.]|nr:glycosyltransferase [Flavisolibacter sp.]